MAPTTIGPIARTYYKWKALRLPWRKRFFVGYDLQGNTYWEFKLTKEETRLRRIVNYPRSTHYSQVQVSPLWHQWLRHMRPEPPSLDEQSGDLVRQERMKYLAAEADARWEAKPKVMEDVKADAAAPRIGARSTEAQTDTRAEEPQRQKPKKSEDNDPWAKAKAKGPSEDWQPAAWNPSAKR